MQNIKTIRDFYAQHDDVAPIHECFFCSQVIVSYFDHVTERAIIASIKTEDYCIDAVSYSFEDLPFQESIFINESTLSNDEKAAAEKTDLRSVIIERVYKEFKAMCIKHITAQ